jgi:hypothetical protein
VCYSAAYSQSDSSAKIYIIRATGYQGWAVNFRIIVNDSLSCKIANNRYSVVELKPGVHTFFVTSWDAPRPKAKLGLEVPVEAGKSYYLRVIHKQRFAGVQMYVEEITLNSATPLLKKYKEDSNCKY